MSLEPIPEKQIPAEEPNAILVKDRLIRAILRSYDRTVSDLAKNRAKGTIDNDYIQQAEILFKYIIPTANKCIYIYTGCFSLDFYFMNSIVSAFESFLNKEGDKNIVVLCECGFDAGKVNNHPVYGRSEFCFVDMGGERINGGQHFIVTDSSSYREEKSSDKELHEAYKARASFNDESKADELIGAANRYINRIKFEND